MKASTTILRDLRETTCHQLKKILHNNSMTRTACKLPPQVAAAAIAVAALVSPAYSERPAARSSKEQVFQFSLNGFSGNSYSIVFDPSAGTLEGSVVVPTERKIFRYKPPQPVRLNPADLTTVNEIVTRAFDFDSSIQPGIGYAATDGHADGDFPKICRGSAKEKAAYDENGRGGNCQSLTLTDSKDFDTVRDILKRLSPPPEPVYWMGNDYRLVNDQPAAGVKTSLYDLMKSAKLGKPYINWYKDDRGGDFVLTLDSQDAISLSGRIIDQSAGQKIFELSHAVKLRPEPSRRLLEVLKRTQLEVLPRAECPNGEINHHPTYTVRFPDAEPREYGWPEKMCNTVSSGELFKLIAEIFFTLNPPEV